MKIEQAFVNIMVSLPVTTVWNRGVHNMDYKELIIKLLEKITNENFLKYLYILAKEFAGEE